MSELPREIEAAFEALDARAAMRAERVSPERIASRVLARLAAEPHSAGRPWAWTWAWSAPLSLRVAAAAVVVVLAGTIATVSLREGSTPRSVALPLAVQGVDSLSQQEAEAVLKVVDALRPVNGGGVVSSALSLDRMSEEQLRALLQAMQSSEGAL